MRKIIQDILVVKKKSDLITDDSMARVQSSPKPEKMETDEMSIKRQNFKNIFPDKKRKFEELYEKKEKVSKNSRVFLWTISIIAVGTLLFFISGSFATATLTISPKSESATLNDTYAIYLATSTPGLHYQIIALTRNLSQSLPTTGEANVQLKAMGQAIIYNDYSASSQELVVNTRLETASGLVYRITKQVIVPGITTVKGVKTPGSIEVNIVADQPGASYNMKVSDLKGDFTIPGFEGTAKYTGFYARLSGDAAGGFIGTAKTASADDISNGRDTLKSTLQTDLIQDLYATTTSDQTVFKNGYFIEYTDLPDSSDANSYSISEEATLYAVVFNTNELSTFIANNKLTDYDGSSSVDALWDDNASIGISGSTATPWLEDTLQANFSGSVDIVWAYDTQAILDEIKGQNKSVLNDVLVNDISSITNITASIIPPWVSAFPRDEKKIKVIDSVRDSM